MGEGRLVGSPTEDTGLRVAWSRYWDSDLLFFTLSTNMKVEETVIFLYGHFMPKSYFSEIPDIR